MHRTLSAVKRSGDSVLLQAQITAPAGRRMLRAKVVLSSYLEQGEPIAGARLSDDVFFALFGEAERASCRERACRILAAAPNSRRALSEKLHLRGYAEDAVRDAVEALVARGYLNEEDQLLRLVELGIGKHYSRRKLLAAILRKGYSASAASEAMQKAGYDEEQVKRKLLETHLSPTASDEERARLLVRHGFVPNDVD